LQNALAGNVEAELKLDRQRLNDLLDGKTAATDAHTEAYKMLLVASCNQWHKAMPFMFERISDYTELLLPDDLLSDYSIVADIRNGMSDMDCQQEELIGWLYQFYIADKKDDVFEGLKKNIKITAENIPAATQLFTPRWIVRYMVENTLGKLWLNLKPNSKLRQFMPYHIEASEGNAPAPLPEGIKGVTDITFLDPCQGSGHVLVYAFDLFIKIYEEEGYNTNEIPALILKHNLFGIDIDERAAQLAAFALTMKARSYHSRFLRKPVQPHVIALENVSEETIRQSVKLPISINGNRITDHKDLSLHLLTQANNFGSLIQIKPEEIDIIKVHEGSIWQEQEQKLLKHAEYLSNQYHCVVTNPPYLGGNGMNISLKTFANKNYEISKSDLFSMFIDRSSAFLMPFGFSSMITMQSWMFLGSFEKFRKNFFATNNLLQLFHTGPGIFPELGAFNVLTTVFVISKSKENSIETCFIKANECVQVSDKINLLSNKAKYIYKKLSTFEVISGFPFVYWLSTQALLNFKQLSKLGDICPPRQGMATTDNLKFIRLWWELPFDKIGIDFEDSNQAKQSGKKWFPYNKGGNYRKWYGNNEYLCNWENDGYEIKHFYDNDGKLRPAIRNEKYYFNRGIVYSLFGFENFGVRYKQNGFIFDVSGSSIFPEQEIEIVLAFLSSNVAFYYLRALAPTVNFQVGDLARLPLPKLSINNKELVTQLAIENINSCKNDWDSVETSWDFNKSFIAINKGLSLQLISKQYLNNINNQRNNLRLNEEQLNKIFIDVYNLSGEVACDVNDRDLSIKTKETLEIIEELLSYIIGVIFGRYCLDKPGLILANQGETIQDYLKQVPNPCFMPDEDNIIPVTDGEWFTDDIVGRFKVFLKAALGDEHLEENLRYLEETIGKDIRKYFVKDFYNDHIKRYKKRPIYWMFSSPKGYFKALIYMHRYQPDLCSKMLNDYLQAFISKLEAAKRTETMLSLREDISVQEKTLAIKEIEKYEAMLKDCREYEKTLFTIATQKISIDLDDGVKANYQKFKEVLVPIKGLEKEEE
jgi:hypothetical protein